MPAGSNNIEHRNKRVVRDYLELIVNTGDISRIHEFISPEYVEVYRNQRHPLGIDGAIEHVRGVRAVYPDLHIIVEQQIAEGEWIATLNTVRGTHAGGEWMGIAPTNKKLEFTGVNIDRVVDGLIVEHGGAANLLEPLLEAGAIRIVSARDAEHDAVDDDC